MRKKYLIILALFMVSCEGEGINSYFRLTCAVQEEVLSEADSSNILRLLVLDFKTYEPVPETFIKLISPSNKEISAVTDSLGRVHIKTESFKEGNYYAKVCNKKLHLSGSAFFYASPYKRHSQTLFVRRGKCLLK